MDKRLDYIFRRRSIRRYADKPIAAEDIKSLLEAGMAAPSASNLKSWHFICLEDKRTLAELAVTHPYGDMLEHAALGIVVCGDPSVSGWWVQDCTAATENILIAVAALGLGAVWIGCHTQPDREAAVRKVLGIPENIGVLSLLSIGYPAEEKIARTQYDAKKIHKNAW